MADKPITGLPPLQESNVRATDPLPIVSLSGSATMKVTTKDLVQAGVGLIDDASIPGAKVDFSLPDGSVGTAQLADKAVTAAKLGDSSSAKVVATLPAAGDFIGQLVVLTSNNEAYIWGGAQWEPFKNSAGVVDVVGSTGTYPQTDITVADLANDGTYTIGASLPLTTGPAHFLAGPTGASGAVSQRPISGPDLPVATDNDPGAVVVSGQGLKVDVNGGIDVNNTVAAQTGRSLATWDEYGLVQSGSPILPGDLPLATDSSVGVVMPGLNLQVNATGELSIANVVTGGEYTKVTVNDSGLVIDGDTLVPDDIPTLPASKIVGGTLAPSLIGAKSITREMLADYSVSYIQEGEPTNNNPGPIGCLWFQESTAQLRMWNGNSWMSVGFGRLSADNLRFGGTINADTGKVTGVTPAGVTGGLVIGGSLPAATDGLGGLYVVVDTAGNNISVTPAISYDAGDWCLCVNETEGWVRIDTMGGGGGGGGVDLLSQLLDVLITSPTEGDLLVYGSNALWNNESALNGDLTTIKLKNSTVLNEAPTNLAIGEIYVNANVGSPAAYIEDSDGGIVQIAGVGSISTPDATETVKGIAKIATTAEVSAGVDDATIVTPAKLAAATPAAQNLQSVCDEGSTTTTGITAGAITAGGTITAQNSATEGCFLYQDGAVEGFNGGSQKWYISSSGEASFDGAVTVGSNITAAGDLAINTDALFVDASAKKVGIGTASPSVYGVHAVNAANSVYFQADSGSVSTLYGSSVAGTGVFGTFTNHALAAYTNSTERLQIDTSGSVLIGPSGSPATTITAAGSATFGGSYDISSSTGYGTKIYTESGSQKYGAVVVQASGSNTTYAKLFEGYNGLTRTSYIAANGDAEFTGPLTVYDAAAGSANDLSFIIRDPGNTADVASVSGAGAATFKSTVQAGGGNNTAVSLAAYNNSSSSSVPTIFAQNDNASGKVWSAYTGGVETSSITADGTITAAGYNLSSLPTLP